MSCLSRNSQLQLELERFDAQWSDAIIVFIHSEWMRTAFRQASFAGGDNQGHRCTPRGGCTGLKELDVESEEYEVGGVVCNDGKSYDIKLDKSFNVISKREDHL